MNNQMTFHRTLANCYAALYEKPEYALAKSKHTPEQLATIMTEGLMRGHANKDGEGIKTTCKILGIKYTYEGIREYLFAA